MHTDLSIWAGPRAYREILKNGLLPEHVSHVIGSAGGPKALVLTGLDSAVFGDWLIPPKKPRWLVGSSIATWRFASALQNNPRIAFERFASLYIGNSLAEHAGRNEITAATKTMLAELVGSSEAKNAIFNHENYRLAIVASRCKGLGSYDNRFLLAAMLGAAFLSNFLSPSTLRAFFERVIFHDPRDMPPIEATRGNGPCFVAFERASLIESLLATTAIPFAIDGVAAADGWPAGIYRDGGLVDYNFCSLTLTDPGIVLFPHFSSDVIASWFDKGVPARYRKRRGQNLDDLLIVAPSAKFIARLPYQKIPDRRDYKFLCNQERIRYWSFVASESRRIGDQFMNLAERGQLANIVKPLPI